MQKLLLACACLAIFTTLGIVLSVLFESIQFFRSVPVDDFVFGLDWSPQTAIREDQVGSSGSFGAVPLFVGTLLISAVAMCMAVPVGLMSAIYLAEYASKSNARFCQAGPRSVGRYSHRGLWLFCRPHSGAIISAISVLALAFRSPLKVRWPPVV